MKNVGDKVAREFIARFWIPTTIRPWIGVFDPGGNIQIFNSVLEEVQSEECVRWEREYRTILLGDTEIGGFYFNIDRGGVLAPGSHVFWNVTTEDGEHSPRDAQHGVIELA